MLKKYFLFAILMVAAGSFLYAGASMLDGKTFDGATGEKGKDAGQKDTLIFAEGKFRSTGCDQYGFAAVDYTATKDGDAWKFTATATSEKEGSIQWTGTVKGDSVEGTYVWTKSGQKDIEYWFKGSLKK